MRVDKLRQSLTLFGALSLSSSVAVCLLGCATSLEEVQAQMAAQAALTQVANTPADAPKPPDIPKEIVACLMQQACAAKVAARSKSAKSTAADVKKACESDDGIVMELVQVDKNKRACTTLLLDWWNKQKNIIADASDKANLEKHPRSTAAPKAGWP